MLGFGQADGRSAGFPFAALFEQFDALETLENGTLAADGGTGLETVVLGHRVRWFEIRGTRNLGTCSAACNPKITIKFYS